VVSAMSKRARIVRIVRIVLYMLFIRLHIWFMGGDCRGVV